jgi:hypothetical protein
MPRIAYRCTAHCNRVLPCADLVRRRGWVRGTRSESRRGIVSVAIERSLVPNARDFGWGLRFAKRSNGSLRGQIFVQPSRPRTKPSSPEQRTTGAEAPIHRLNLRGPEGPLFHIYSRYSLVFPQPFRSLAGCGWPSLHKVFQDEVGGKAHPPASSAERVVSPTVLGISSEHRWDIGSSRLSRENSRAKSRPYLARARRDEEGHVRYPEKSE